MWSNWLISMTVVFILSALCWKRIRDLWKLPDGWDWLRGKLGLVLMDGAMLSKSLIQFSVDGQGCVPSLLFDLRPNYGGDMQIMVTSFKRSHACTATLRATNPAAGHHWPMPPSRLLDTHGQVWVSFLWGHCSFLSGPGMHKLLFVPSESLFPQSYVSSGMSMVELMVTSSKRAYAIPRSILPRAPSHEAVHCWPIPLQERFKHGSGSVSAGSLGPGGHKVCFSPLRVSGAHGFDSKCNFTSPTLLLGQHCAATTPVLHHKEQ